MLFADTVGKPEVTALAMRLDEDTTIEELMDDEETPVVKRTEPVELAPVTRGMETVELAPVPRKAEVLLDDKPLVLFDPEVGAPPAQ